MRFVDTPLPGAYVIELEPSHDERGFFARAFSECEFESRRLVTHYPQCNVSYSEAAFTLRGLHYAALPHREEKLVRCTRGVIYDVIVDLRADSPCRFRWFASELSEHNHRMLYVPAGCAHGFLTLAPSTEVFYQMGAHYVPEVQRGVRWNDPRFGISWPHEPLVMSARDRDFPDY
ncbi:MAG: dTDP-4-dehydrorhamnose 3,5-epimerase [Luteitalea sp.]|nr:dTDP-4-dehydrorhamnose 3,5-epimerase [Luteitalea sp.]